MYACDNALVCGCIISSIYMYFFSADTGVCYMRDFLVSVSVVNVSHSYLYVCNCLYRCISTAVEESRALAKGNQSSETNDHGHGMVRTGIQDSDITPTSYLCTVVKYMHAA